MNNLKRMQQNVIVRKYSNRLQPVHKAVIVSRSNDIFSNLALEDWFYKYHDFKDNRHLLMLWINNPCVVIGRHQNPWLECNASKLKNITAKADGLTDGVKLARRNSGGGTVYHDRGNLNLTFFTPNTHYNRKSNLELIRNSILDEYGLKVDISAREDLTIREHKVSGTAAKLARLVAYHHCTLLVNVNKELLYQSLHKQTDYEIKTNATRSVKSKILNITDENDKINVENLLTTIGVRYLVQNNIKFLENTPNLLNSVKLSNEQFSMNDDTKIFRGGSSKLDYNTKRFHLVEPNETNFPGLDEIRSSLVDWQWVFGKTPKFSVCKMFRIKSAATSNKIIYTEGASYAFMLNIEIEKGRITNVNVTAPRNYSGRNLNNRIVGINDFRGMEYSDDILEQLLFALNEEVGENKQKIVNVLS